MKEGYKHCSYTGHVITISTTKSSMFSTSECVAPRIYRSPLLAWNQSNGRPISYSFCKQTAKSCPCRTEIKRNNTKKSFSIFIFQFTAELSPPSGENSGQALQVFVRVCIPFTHHRQTLAWRIQLAEAAYRQGPTSTSQNQQQRQTVKSLFAIWTANSATSSESLSICVRGNVCSALKSVLHK